MLLNQDESAVKKRENFQKGKEVIVVSAGGAGAVASFCTVSQIRIVCCVVTQVWEWLLFQMDILG